MAALASPGGRDIFGNTSYVTLPPELWNHLNRKTVIWTIMDGPSWVVFVDLGFKMLVGELSREYVRPTPSFSVLDKALDALYEEAKTGVISTLKTLHEGFEFAGYMGGYWGLQLDLTTIAY